MLPAVHDTGTGDAVLFLHAFTLDASQWDHQVAALSGDLRCVRIDLLGLRRVAAATRRRCQRSTAFAAAVLAALDSLRHRAFTVVGLSMGGYLAFALWRLAPERIRALALCSTRAGRRRRRAARDDRLAMAEQVEREHSVESIVEPMVERLLGPPARSGGAHRRTRSADGSGDAHPRGSRSRSEQSRLALTAPTLLASIDVPTLVDRRHAGCHHPARRSSCHELTRSRVRGWSSSDCGHLGNLEQPRAFNEALGEFLVPAAAAS